MLNGAKTLISNAGIADLYAVFASTDPAKGPKAISCFLVPADAPGLRFVGAAGVERPASAGRARLRGLPGARRRAARREGRGYALGLATLDRLRPTVAAAACGMAARALAESLAHVKQRQQFGKPLAEFQLVQQKLARMATDLTAARLLTYRAAYEKDQGQERITSEAAMAKSFATEMAQRAWTTPCSWSAGAACWPTTRWTGCTARCERSGSTRERRRSSSSSSRGSCSSRARRRGEVREHVTLLRPEEPTPGGAGVSTGLPPDLLEQVRGRVRLLAMLLDGRVCPGSGRFPPHLDREHALGHPAPARGPEGRPVPPGRRHGRDRLRGRVRWLARRDWISPAVRLVYQIVICLEIGITMPWQFYVSEGYIPPLTWAPTVIVLFPLIMPGPPRRMLAAAIAAGATGPLGLLLLDLGGKAAVHANDYFRSVFGSIIAVVFAYLGARVVYRLGREVSAARELGATACRSDWAAAGWARSGARGIACWRGRRRSS